MIKFINKLIVLLQNIHKKSKTYTTNWISINEVRRINILQGDDATNSRKGNDTSRILLTIHELRTIVVYHGQLHAAAEQYEITSSSQCRQMQSSIGENIATSTIYLINAKLL